jgi:hypothetical protein
MSEQEHDSVQVNFLIACNLFSYMERRSFFNTGIERTAKICRIFRFSNSKETAQRNGCGVLLDHLCVRENRVRIG